MVAVSRSTGTTIVNAAFLQEVKDSNTELWRLLDSARELCRCRDCRRELAAQFVNCLGALRDSVGLQFSLEETYGFVENGRPTVHFGVGSAASAKIQHRELYLQIHDICEQVEEAQYRGTIVRDLAIYFEAFEQFDDAFRAHEELESELIRCGLGVSRLEL